MTGDEVSNYGNGAKPMTRLSPVSGVLMDVTRDLARGGIIPDGGENFSNPGTWRVTAVPEASTWAMMLLGFAGLGFMAYRRTLGSATLPTAN